MSVTPVAAHVIDESGVSVVSPGEFVVSHASPASPSALPSTVGYDASEKVRNNTCCGKVPDESPSTVAVITGVPVTAPPLDVDFYTVEGVVATSPH